MDIPINPTISANVADHSATDDSIRQEGVTINANNGSIVNTNSGNKKGHDGGMTRVFATLLIILFSIACDALICSIIYYGQARLMDSIDVAIEHMNQSVVSSQEKTDKALDQTIKNFGEETKKLEKQGREGSIWILRRDMFREMDLHEATKTISQKQYKALRDEFDYYTSIGGNHDAKERLNLFTAKILSGEVKVVQERK